MKSYTNLEQSLKLAEILPNESVDMKFPYFGDGQYGRTALFGEPIWFSGGKDIPCWSLAALLEVLPHRIDEIYDLDFGKPSANEGWYVCYGDVDYFDKYYIANSNLIDACYEMILKLHEEKRL